MSRNTTNKLSKNNRIPGYTIKLNSTLFYELFLSCSLGNCSLPLSLRPDKLSLDGRPSNDPSKGATKWIMCLSTFFFTSITYDSSNNIKLVMLMYLITLVNQTYLLYVHLAVANVADQQAA